MAYKDQTNVYAEKIFEKVGLLAAMGVFSTITYFVWSFGGRSAEYWQIFGIALGLYMLGEIIKLVFSGD